VARSDWLGRREENGKGKAKRRKGKGDEGGEKKKRSNQSSWITVSGEVQLVPPFSGPSRLFTSSAVPYFI
jgi:hypothetical protein